MFTKEQIALANALTDFNQSSAPTSPAMCGDQFVSRAKSALGARRIVQFPIASSSFPACRRCPAGLRVELSVPQMASPADGTRKSLPSMMAAPPTPVPSVNMITCSNPRAAPIHASPSNAAWRRSTRESTGWFRGNRSHTKLFQSLQPPWQAEGNRPAILRGQAGAERPMRRAGVLVRVGSDRTSWRICRPNPISHRRRSPC